MFKFFHDRVIGGGGVLGSTKKVATAMNTAAAGAASGASGAVVAWVAQDESEQASAALQALHLVGVSAGFLQEHAGIFSAAFGALVLIAAAVEGVRANKKNCEIVGRRCAALKAPLKSIADHYAKACAGDTDGGAARTEAMTQLVAQLDVICKAVDAYRDRSWLAKAWGHGGFKQTVDAANAAIDRAMQTLQLGLAAEALEQNRAILAAVHGLQVSPNEALERLAEEVRAGRLDADSAAARAEALDAKLEALGGAVEAVAGGLGVLTAEARDAREAAAREAALLLSHIDDAAREAAAHDAVARAARDDQARGAALLLGHIEEGIQKMLQMQSAFSEKRTAAPLALRHVAVTNDARQDACVAEDAVPVAAGARASHAPGCKGLTKTGARRQNRCAQSTECSDCWPVKRW
jgi:hypothetical protein